MTNYERRKQMILDLMNDSTYVSMKEKELAILLQVAPEDRPELSAILKELLAENRIQISKRGKYSKGDGQSFIGTFNGSVKGFGFVRVDGEDNDFFIGRNYTAGAFHGDTVQIVPLYKKHGEHREAKVVNIIERGITEIVGEYDSVKNQKYGFVITDNKFIDDIFIPSDKTKGAKKGQKVVVKIKSYGSTERKAEGEIIEILGFGSEKGVDMLSIIRALGIPEVFPSNVLDMAARMPEQVEKEAVSSTREDLRSTVMVTIDGEDAKDLDDAVSLTMDGDQYVLGVHIADVSEYVKEYDALDREALKRGTSVYIADRVIPMLPVELSNGICSLNAGVDRLAMSCIMHIDSTGEVRDYEIKETLIKVKHRMNYSSVNRLINGDIVEQKKYEDVTPMLLKMKELSDIIRSRRVKKGAIDFDIPESKLTLDENGVCIDVHPYEANDATRLIEDFMLAANETVASHMYWQNKPFLYRIHEQPNPDKIDSLSIMLKKFGYYLKGDHENIHPKEIQKVINEFMGTDREHLVTRISLRSMQQARYSPECEGHFGLSIHEYTHFTSPIRRYPDLQIHRILKDELNGRLDEKRMAHYKGILEDVAKMSSKAERRANEAERDSDKLKKAEYISQHIDEEYEGIISGVTNYGIYVELPSTVEGLVHISKIPGDVFEFNEYDMLLQGQNTGVTYTLGQNVRIRVAEVDMKLKTVDFDLL